MTEKPLPSAAEERFDVDAARRIVALAERLQHAQLESMSQQQLRELAAEVGIGARYIDASIAAVRGQTQAPVRAALRPWLRKAGALVRKPDNRPFINSALIGLS